MTYSLRRVETLRRLGVEQLPDLCVEPNYDEMTTPLRGKLPVRTMPVSILQLDPTEPPARTEKPDRYPVADAQRACPAAKLSG